MGTTVGRLGTIASLLLKWVAFFGALTAVGIGAAWYHVKIAGYAVGPGALSQNNFVDRSLIGETVNQAQTDLRGSPALESGPYFLVCLACSSCMTTEAVLELVAATGPIPLVIVFAGSEDDAPAYIGSIDSAARVYLDETGDVVPFRMLSNAPQFAYVDESNTIIALPGERQTMLQFLGGGVPK